MNTHKSSSSFIPKINTYRPTYSTQSHLQHREQSSQSAPHPSCSRVSSQCEAACTPTPHPGSFLVGESVRKENSESVSCHMFEYSLSFNLFHLVESTLSITLFHQHQILTTTSTFSHLLYRFKQGTFLIQMSRLPVYREAHHVHTYQGSTITERALPWWLSVFLIAHLLSQLQLINY